jgi:hypothetical protein
MKKKIMLAISVFIVIIALIIFLTQRASSPAVATQGLSEGDKIALRDPFAGPEAEEASPSPPPRNQRL